MTHLSKIAFFLILLSGCASNPALNKPPIEVGDSQKRLERIFGSPTFNVPSVLIPDARAFYYVSNKVVCGFTVRDEVVVRVTPCDAWTRTFMAQLKVLRDSEVLPRYQQLLGR